MYSKNIWVGSYICNGTSTWSLGTNLWSDVSLDLYPPAAAVAAAEVVVDLVFLVGDAGSYQLVLEEWHLHFFDNSPAVLSAFSSFHQPSKLLSCQIQNSISCRNRSLQFRHPCLVVIKKKPVSWLNNKHGGIGDALRSANRLPRVMSNSPTDLPASLNEEKKLWWTRRG